MNNEVLLSLRNITKVYYGITALDNVSLDIKKGEIHGLVGENGAGKSTMIKVIAGSVVATSGEVFYENERMSLKTTAEAIDKGIGVVYQEFNLFPNLTVYENLFFGIEIKYRSGILNHKKMIEKAGQLIEQLGFSFDATTKVSELSTAYQQIVEIAKCINHNTNLIIMDEPSASLSENEVNEMFKTVKRLNEQGVTIIYISHKLNEILEITNRITVLRDGKYIATLDTSETEETDLIKLMVGRDLDNIYPAKGTSEDEVVLECKNLSGGIVEDASFQLKKGEVLGFGGLVGSGRTELMRMIFGADKYNAGEIYVKGELVKIRSTRDAIKHGMGLIPEDRKLHGLVLNKTIFFNGLLPSLKDFSSNIVKIVKFRRAEKHIERYYQQLKVKAYGMNQTVLNLSGGNQQKVVLVKWLVKNCDVLILDEPTRGIDIGAKQEIYQLITDLASEGASIIVVSSEMPELIGVSQRIMVMNEGRIMGCLSGKDMNQEEIMKLASGRGNL